MPNADRHLAYLLHLRLRARRNPRSLALIDRCLAMVARANTASAEDLRQLDAEVADLSNELALRFGAPRNVKVQ